MSEHFPLENLPPLPPLPEASIFPQEVLVPLGQETLDTPVRLLDHINKSDGSTPVGQNVQEWLTGNVELPAREAVGLLMSNDIATMSSTANWFNAGKPLDGACGSIGISVTHSKVPEKLIDRVRDFHEYLEKSGITPEQAGYDMQLKKLQPHQVGAARDILTLKVAIGEDETAAQTSEKFTRLAKWLIN